jgi:hypothetical protein
MINPDNLIPPDSELAQLLLQWTEDTDTRTWNVANLTNELIAELEGGDVTRTDIYKAVAKRCKGKKPNTIRRWAEVAADFDDEVQAEYKDLLSFDHFKTARRLFKDGLAPSAEYVLQWAVEGNDMKLNAGKFHTVGECLLHFLPGDTFENMLFKTWEKSKEKLYDQFLMVDNDTARVNLIHHWTEIDEQIQRLDKSKEV